MSLSVKTEHSEVCTNDRDQDSPIQTDLHCGSVNKLFTGLSKGRGVARIFQRGGHTVSNIIVMAFSPRNIVGCLLKKKAYKGGGHGHPRTPLAMPLKGAGDGPAISPATLRFSLAKNGH